MRKKIKKISVVILLIIFTQVISAQSLFMVNGDLNMLRDQKELLVKYDFSNVKIGSVGTEEEYLKRKRDELNSKEVGLGDKYVQEWEQNKDEKYKPRFEFLFAKYAKNKIQIGEALTNASYTLIIKTVNIFPGGGNGLAQIPSYVSFEFIIVKTVLPEIELARMKIDGLQGIQGGFVPNFGERIQESYSKAGKMLAKFLIDSIPLK